jgi:WD40 repeat protein
MRADIWSITRATGQMSRLTRDGQSSSPEWSADGSRIGWIHGDSAGASIRWQAADGSGTPAVIATQGRVPFRFVFTPDGKSIAVVVGGPFRHDIVMVSVDGKSPPRALAGSDVDELQPSVSPDGRWLAMYRSFTARLFVYGLPEIDPAATLNVSSPIHSFQFSPRNDELAVACRDQVEFWSTTTWQLKHVITNHNHVLYSPDGPTMWLSSDFRGACLYDTRTASPLLPLPAGTFPLALSPDGGILAVSVDGRRLQLWNLAEARAQLARLNLDWE